MDGVFMKKCKVWALGFVLFAGILFLIGLVKDQSYLQKNLIRLHIVANSDSAEDQSVKLFVRDAVTGYLQEQMTDIYNVEEAKTHILSVLPELEQLVNSALRQQGTQDTARVTLMKEAFDTRHYDTFSLPAGIYESLRITIGEGEGKNWWCVVFPSLCLPSATDGFQDTAVSSGFDEGLSNTLSGERGFRVRFYFMDCVGKMQNLFNFR